VRDSRLIHTLTLFHAGAACTCCHAYTDQLFLTTRRHCQAQVHIGNLRERLERAAGRGDVRKIVDNLNRACDDGRLGGDKALLLTFLHDLAYNLNAKRSSGYRQVCV
jgi:hypothetical protein